MNAWKKVIFAACILSALALILNIPTLVARSESSSGVAAQDLKPKSTPEMDRLKFYLGDWDFTETYPKGPFVPGGGKNTGLYTSKLGPGGNSLINTFHSQGPVGDFEGLLIITWDAKEKNYKSYIFGNDFPGAVVETGQFEGDALVFRTEFTMGDRTMKLRNVTKFVAPGNMVVEEYSTSKDAPESLLVHVDAKKR
jgi:Protein of unknown function (DUF1579)